MTFEERFDALFNVQGSEDFDSDQMMEFLHSQVSAPVVVCTIGIQGQRPPTVVSNVDQSDSESVEGLAQALTSVANDLHNIALNALRAQIAEEKDADE